MVLAYPQLTGDELTQSCLVRVTVLSSVWYHLFHEDLHMDFDFLG